jgi:hypothetical protein
MPGGEGQPASGTWALWPLAGANPGGMLTTSASRYQARQAELATQRGMLWLDPTGRFQRGTEGSSVGRRDGCHPEYGDVREELSGADRFACSASEGG